MDVIHKRILSQTDIGEQQRDLKISALKAGSDLK